MRKGRSYNLTNLILVSFVAFLLVAMLLQMMLFNRSSSLLISRQTDQFTQSSLENLSSILYSRFKDVENSLVQIYDYKNFIKALSSNNLADGYSSLAYEMAQNSFDPDQNILALYIYTIDHTLISSYRHAQTPIYSYPEDIYDRTMEGSEGNVKQIIDENPPVMTVSGYYNPNRNVRLVRFVLRILENAKTPVGYLVCDIDPKNYISVLKKYQYNEAQALWIQSEKSGKLVSLMPDDPDTVELYNDIVKIVESGEQVNNQNNYAFYSVPLRKYPVSICSLIPKTFLNINQVMLQKNTLQVFFIVLTLFAVLYFFISRLITKPLSEMIATMNRIKNGETNLRLDEVRLMELNLLGQEFNDMLNRIESLISQEYLTTIQLNDAKYKALQMQVNPHFLFNTMDTMSAIATAKGCSTVSALCKALSDLFRYSLEMENPLASISEELKHLHNYWYVITTRTGGNISLSIDLPDDLIDEKIPRLSLQPLVENAILHGLRDKHGEKKIIVSAWKTADVLRVMVSDNGVGMSSDIIKRVENADPEDALSSDKSIGIVNINSRLILLYGNKYCLKINSEVGHGTTVTISVPIMEKEK